MKFSAEAQLIGTAVAAAAHKFLTAYVSVAQTFQAYLERPDVQARMHKAGLALQEARDRIEAVDSPGYTPYFEQLGHTGFAARLYTGVIRYRAKRFYAENQDKRIALVAFHRLAKRPHWDLALVPQIARLRDHCWEADFLDEAFHAAGCAERKREFLGLLQGTRGGDFSQCPRLLGLITLIAPSAPSPKGRPMSFDSALHQTFLRLGAHLGGRQGYTYGLVRNSFGVADFIDEATVATRIELGRATFNPIAARRAVKSRRARDIEVLPKEGS